MAELTNQDGKDFMKGTWVRTIKGKKDGLRLQFGNGTKQADGSFVSKGKYDPSTNRQRQRLHGMSIHYHAAVR